MANSKDFFDPAIQQAQFLGDRVSNLTEKELLSHGAKIVGDWEIKLDPTAQLAALERFVKEKSLTKIFGDGQVIDSIDPERVVNVKFFELKDGSGVQIAKITGGTNAMLALLSKADMDDLILTPQYREPKRQPKIDQPKMATLAFDGAEIKVRLDQPKQEAPTAPRTMPSLDRVAGAMPISMHNPVASKEFFTRAWTKDSMALPSPDARNMALACIITISPEAHPTDESWPAGITVTNKKSGEVISGPKKAIAVFEAAREGQEGPVLTREDVFAQLAARKAPKM